MSKNSWWYSHWSRPKAGVVSSNPRYTFGFTGWSLSLDECGEWVDDLDPFEVFVRETRKAAGLEVSPPRQKWVPKTSQILFSGTISVPATKFHRQLRSIDGGQDSGCNQSSNSSAPPENDQSADR